MNTAIFDMDGLLLDTEPLWGDAMMGIAAKHHIKVTLPQLRYTTGLRIYEVTAFWKAKFSWNTQASSDTVAEEIIDEIVRLSITKGRIMPGVIECLEWMQNEEFKIGVATSSPTRMMNELFLHFGLNQYFSATISADTTQYGKPNPAVFLQCAECLGTAPYDCIALEDSVNGMIAAKAARMKVVVVPDPLKFDDKKFALAELKLHSLTELNEQLWQTIDN